MTEQITPEYLSFATEHHASDIFIIAGRPLSFKTTANCQYMANG